MAEYVESSLYNGEVGIKFYPLSHQYWAAVDGEKFKRKPGVTTICGIKDKSIGLMSWAQNITADFLLSKIEKGEKISSDDVLEAVIQNEVQRDAAADIGSQIHGWVEAYIKFKLGEPGYPEMPAIPDFPEAVTGVNGFLDWEKSHDVKFLSSERVVFSKEHDYIGTLDIEAMVDGRRCLVDLKSSNGLYNTVRTQTAAYVVADVEESNKPYDGRWAIRLSKFTEEEYHRKEERKKEMRKAIARIKGTEFKDSPVKPFVVFEAKDLDEGENFIDRDFKVFLAMKEIYKWDALTDSYRNGSSW